MLLKFSHDGDTCCLNVLDVPCVTNKPRPSTVQAPDLNNGASVIVKEIYGVVVQPEDLSDVPH